MLESGRFFLLPEKCQHFRPLNFNVPFAMVYLHGCSSELKRGMSHKQTKGLLFTFSYFSHFCIILNHNSVSLGEVFPIT